MKNFFLLLAAFSLMGWGCGKEKQVAVKQAEPAPVYQSLVYLPEPPAQESEQKRNLRELREVILAFRDTRSFRAKLQSENDGETITGQLEVMKPNRFKGKLKSSNDNTEGEVIGVEKTIYVKQTDGRWIPINSPQLAKAFQEAFKATLSGQHSVLESQLPDGLAVSKTKDARQDCDRYETTLDDASGNSFNLKICVAKSWPKTIEITGDSGYIRVEYFDINSLITIERPTVPKEYRQ